MKAIDIETKLFKKCDICGKSFTGNHYSVIDENFKVQNDLIQCAKCYATQCAGE